jgi:hypothetical protein
MFKSLPLVPIPEDLSITSINVKFHPKKLKRQAIYGPNTTSRCVHITTVAVEKQ